jgi:hypothetical protein
MQLNSRILMLILLCTFQSALATELQQSEGEPVKPGWLATKAAQGVEIVRSYLGGTAVDPNDPLAPFKQSNRFQVAAVNTSFRTRVWTEQDFSNFPVLTIKEILRMLEGVTTAQTFGTVPLDKRANQFKTEGYDGYFILWGLAYGTKIAAMWHLGAEHKATAPAELVTNDAAISPCEWLNASYKLTDIEFKRIGYPQKDPFGNTFSLYALEAGKYAFVMSVVRKQQQDYAAAVYEFHKGNGKSVTIDVSVK